MGMFDVEYNEATAIYDLPDGRHVEFGYDDDYIVMDSDDWRLYDANGNKVAILVGNNSHISYGDESLYELWKQWKEFLEDSETHDKPSEPMPLVREVFGDEPEYEFTVLFRNSGEELPEEEIQGTVSYLSNYIFGELYFAEVSHPLGGVDISETIIDAGINNNVLDIVHERASDEDVVQYLDELRYQ